MFDNLNFVRALKGLSIVIILQLITLATNCLTNADKIYENTNKIIKKVMNNKNGQSSKSSEISE